ncbi:MAG: flagellar basal body rod protein FlgB [Lachnospiraceae bacterium]|nr:flagellar basal body rod protein FlgB [Lachnospiraceae bacterium]
MIMSDAFSYVNVLDKAADASWNRQTVISNNIANEDTPFYKRKDVNFKDVLEDEITRIKYEGSLDSAVKEMDYSDIEAPVYVDAPNFSYRIDQNNVDVDTENVELASEQLNYQILTTAIKDEFTRFSTVTRS